MRSLRVLAPILLGGLLCLVVAACGPLLPAPAVGTAQQMPQAVSVTPPSIRPVSTAPAVSSVTVVATPDLAAATVAELDRITFANSQPLVLPTEVKPASFAVLDWSPDGRSFLGIALSEEVLQVGSAGYALQDLYLGDAQTGQVQLVQRNAGWPAWSRDGQTVYFAAGRVEGQRPVYDLYRRPVSGGEAQLVLADVGDTGTRPAVAETESGRLVALDRGHRPMLVAPGSGRAAVQPMPAGYALEQAAGTATQFALAPDGRALALVAEGQAPIVIDLDGTQPAARLTTAAGSAQDLAWSPDSQRLAYATRDGIYVYDRRDGQSQPVVTGQDLGFPSNDPATGFYSPAWAPDQTRLLFAAGTPAWAYDPAGQRFTYTLVTTLDGAQVRPLTQAVVEALSPDGSRAVVSQWSPETGQESKTLVDVAW